MSVENLMHTSLANAMQEIRYLFPCQQKYIVHFAQKSQKNAIMTEMLVLEKIYPNLFLKQPTSEDCR